MKVLVVDDELNSLHIFLDRILGNMNAECAFFQDDVEKIEQYLDSNDVTAAYLDINMTKIDGISLARLLIEKQNNIKIIFVTGTSLKENEVPEDIKSNLVSIIYKPYNKEDIESSLNKILQINNVLEVKMFGHFECFYHNRPVNFSSSKSKELFALLLCFNGKTLTMDTAITYLYPDKELEKAKILYRDAVWRLRQTLKEINFNCVDFQRASLLLNRDNIHCDYYDLINGKKGYYLEGFLVNYDWSLTLEAQIKYLKKGIKDK